jgi:hypothetical protein
VAQAAPAKPVETPKAQNASVAKSATQTPAPTPAPAAQAAPAAATAPGGKEEVFVFNYQVAALASMDQAQTFLKKLDPATFKTSVVTANHEGKNLVPHLRSSSGHGGIHHDSQRAAQAQRHRQHPAALPHPALIQGHIRPTQFEGVFHAQ